MDKSRAKSQTESQEAWKEFWESKAAPSVSDFEFDRGTVPRDREIERLSNEELIQFIDPHPSDVIFDAGCGTGGNIILLQGRVQRFVAMDYAQAAVERCRKRLQAHGIENAGVFHGDVTACGLPSRSVDRVLCLSVFQYVTDAQVRAALREFARVLKERGVLILHVKNLNSLYLSTLWLMKHLLLVFGRQTKLEHFRSFAWYVREIEAAGFHLLDHNSFNLLSIDRMPRTLLIWLQRMELAHHAAIPVFLRRFGADLKLRAQLVRG